MAAPTMSSMQMGLTLIGWGLAVWVPAGIVSYAINRRRFMRRNPAGIEEFETYGNFVMTRWVETGFMLLARSLQSSFVKRSGASAMTAFAAARRGCVLR